MKKLSVHQNAVVAALRPINMDIPIASIYERVYGKCDEELTVRKMQQKLAPIFAAINRKLHAYEIKPGELKQTYGYYKTKKA